MIEYNLRGAHPGYREAVPQILDRLVEQYPGAMLDEVSLYPYKAGDKSLANVNRRGRISLNPYWFAVSPTYLAAAQTPRRHACDAFSDVTFSWRNDGRTGARVDARIRPLCLGCL